MQKVVGNVLSLGLEATEVDITFTLVNRFLKPIRLKDKLYKTIPKQITTIKSQADGSFETELWPNDAGERFSFYLLEAGSTKTYFYIPFLEMDTADITMLLEEKPCGEAIISYIQNSKRAYNFSERFIEELDIYMLTQDKTRISAETVQLFEKLCQYADEEDPNKKSEMIKALDLKLGETDE